MSYAQFEALSAKCTPHEVEVEACQSYYRMLLQAYPDRYWVSEFVSSTLPCFLVLSVGQLHLH